MKNSKYAAYAIALTAIAAIAFLSYLVFLQGQALGDFDQFAECLTEQGLAMAGTDWCHFCQNQKDLFGNSLSKIDYKNCDLEKEWCNQNQIGLYPAWVNANGMHFTGVKNFQQLSRISGCSLETQA
jgi:hypothetical protein